MFFLFIAATEAGLWATGCCLSSCYPQKCILCMQDPAQQRGRQKIPLKNICWEVFLKQCWISICEWPNQLPFQMVSDKAPEYPCCWGIALTRLHRNLGLQHWSCPGSLVCPANSLSQPPACNSPHCCPCPRVREWSKALGWSSNPQEPAGIWQGRAWTQRHPPLPAPCSVFMLLFCFRPRHCPWAACVSHMKLPCEEKHMTVCPGQFWYCLCWESDQYWCSKVLWRVCKYFP